MTPRIVVLGGFGFFGGAAVERLRQDGYAPLIGSRRPDADVRIDVETPESIDRGLRAGDIVIDAVGPFQERSPALLEAALLSGFHLIDISDSLGYCRRVYARRDDIDRRGIAVLTACSSISSMTAMLVAWSGIRAPARIAAFLAPASRYAAAPGTSASLVHSVGRPITVLEGGRARSKIGWSEPREFALPPPLGRRKGRLFESADAFTLPLVWPSLRDVAFHVHSNVFGLDSVLTLARWVAPVRWLVRRFFTWGLPLAKLLGSPSGCLFYEIAGDDGRPWRFAFVAGDRGYFTPIVPAVLAAEGLAGGAFTGRGLIDPRSHVEADEVFRYLKRIGVNSLVQRPGSDAWEELSGTGRPRR